MLRDFINYSLYDLRRGYFNKEGIIYSPPPVDFKNFVGIAAYKKHVSLLYTQNPGSWLTPVELFKPHYSLGIMEWMIETRKKLGSSCNAPLHIVELGAGTGACAMNILDGLQWKHPDLYKTTKYTIMEYSQKLAHIQNEKLSRFHGDHVHCLQGSASEWNHTIEGPVFVIANEVLDNMAHDKGIFFSFRSIR